MPDPLRFLVPTQIETARLLLRPFRQGDAPALHAAIAESIIELRQHLWFLPWVAEAPSLESAQVRCRQAEAAFLLRTDLPFLAFDRSSGRLVASVGLHRTDWNIPRTEVGYWVRTGELGNGYATEGVTALTKWALDELRATRIELITDEQNTGSRAVADRCGFFLEGIHRNVGRGPDGQMRHNCMYARY
jgi:RimJ/RimL family protein N-acetyltransferase